MLCDTQAERKVSANGCTDGLGNLGDAETSLTKHSRKSESAANFPQYHRLDLPSGPVFCINEGNGWVAHTPEGVLINPWTNAPFRILVDAKKALKYRMKKGFWPGLKPNPRNQAAA